MSHDRTRNVDDTKSTYTTLKRYLLDFLTTCTNMYNMYKIFFLNWVLIRCTKYTDYIYLYNAYVKHVCPAIALTNSSNASPISVLCTGILFWIISEQPRLHIIIDECQDKDSKVFYEALFQYLLQVCYLKLLDLPRAAVIIYWIRGRCIDCLKKRVHMLSKFDSNNDVKRFIIDMSGTQQRINDSVDISCVLA